MSWFFWGVTVGIRKNRRQVSINRCDISRLHCDPARRCRSSFTIFVCPKSLFILPFPYVLRAFSGGLSARELRTAKVGWGARCGFLILGHESGPRILLETGASFVTHFVTNFVPKPPRIFSGLFFPAPKKSTPNPRRLRRGQNPRQFWKLFFSGFSGCSTLVCVAAFGCQYVYADQRRLVS